MINAVEVGSNDSLAVEATIFTSAGEEKVQLIISNRADQLIVTILLDGKQVALSMYGDTDVANIGEDK